LTFFIAREVFRYYYTFYDRARIVRGNIFVALATGQRSDGNMQRW